MTVRYATEKEALLTCLKVWQEISTLKHQDECYTIVIKEIAYRNLSLKEDFNHCPCCEYTLQFSTYERDHIDFNVECSYCPLWEHNGRDFNCERSGSPYEHWRKTKDSSKMLEAIQQVLETGKKIVCDGELD